MIEFSSKFTSEKVLLRREYRARLKQADSKAKELENSLWLLLYRLGFTRLNVDGPSNITFGRNAQSAQKKAIDVIADSTLARIYVECTTQKKPSPKVAKWIAEVSEIRKWDHDGNAGVNVGFVFVCTSEISDSERKQLANAGITLLTSNDLDYFEELRRQYESLAYYQLLSVVFKKKKIVAMNERELEVPAIKCKYNKTSNCYLFGVHPATLIPLASVLHRAGHRSMEVVNAYQRLIKKGKIKSLKTYIKNKSPVFPTNIIISIDEGKQGSQFTPYEGRHESIEHGRLKLPPLFGSISIIDGQHRLFAYDSLAAATTSLVYVVAFDSLPMSEQLQMFVDINKNQTKVSPSLMWDLLPLINPDDDKAAIARVAKALCEGKPKSALWRRIQYDSAPPELHSSSITLESFCTTLSRTRMAKLFKEDALLQFLRLYFGVVQKRHSEHWDREDKVFNLLCSNQGVGSLLMLGDEVSAHLGGDSFMEKKISELLEPLDDFIAENSGTREKVREFKGGSSEANKREIFKKFAYNVASKAPGFASKVILDIEAQEIQEIVDQLAATGETASLEVKEAFLVNTARYRATGALERNDPSSIDGIVKSIVAFSNTEGGKLILGLRDKTWEVVGIDHTDLKTKDNDVEKLISDIRSKVHSHAENVQPLKFQTRRSTEGKTVLIINVKRLPLASFQQHQLATLKEGDRPYHREGGSSVALKLAHLATYCKGIYQGDDGSSDTDDDAA